MNFIELYGKSTEQNIKMRSCGYFYSGLTFIHSLNYYWIMNLNELRSSP